MFKIILQILILIYLIFVVYNLINLQKFNINGFIIKTDDINIIRENLIKLNPIHTRKEINFDIHNSSLDYLHDIINYKNQQPSYVFKNDELFERITTNDLIFDTSLFNESHLNFPIKNSVSIISEKNSIPLKKCIHNYNIIGVLDGEAILYLFNPKHKEEIIDKENYEIKKWGHKKHIQKGDIIMIPPYWSYIQEVEKGIIQYHIDIDTYFTFIPNYLKDIY